MEEKKEIIAEFKRIRREVQDLLTKNIEGPDNEKLDIQEFNLDEDLKEKLLYANVKQCGRLKRYYEQVIVAQDKVSAWIKSFCWDSMSEKRKSIWAIFGNFDVQNYVLLPNDGELEEVLKCLEEQRTIEALMACEDKFEPWNPLSRRFEIKYFFLNRHFQFDFFCSKINLNLNQDPKISTFVPVPPIADFNAEEAEEEEGKLPVDMETLTAFAGSVTHTFVEVDKLHYTQQQLQTFVQTNLQTLMTEVINSFFFFFFLMNVKYIILEGKFKIKIIFK